MEALLPADVTSVTPLCIAGANACPPEDVGGIPGYVDFLDILSDPSHDEHLSMLEWCGGGFAPAVFDQAETNRRLTEIQPLELLDVLRKVEKAGKLDTANRLRERCSAIGSSSAWHFGCVSALT